MRALTRRSAEAAKAGIGLLGSSGTVRKIVGAARLAGDLMALVSTASHRQPAGIEQIDPVAVFRMR